MSSTAIAPTGLLHPTDILRAPNFVNVAVLASSVNQGFDVPTGAKYVSFAGNADFYVKLGSTACLLPTTSVSTGAGNGANELNPTVRSIGSTAATTG